MTRARTSVAVVRPVFETEDFGDALTPEAREQEERLRADGTADEVASARRVAAGRRE